jgi:hypothetical protein
MFVLGWFPLVAELLLVSQLSQKIGVVALVAFNDLMYFKIANLRTSRFNRTRCSLDTLPCGVL